MNNITMSTAKAIVSTKSKQLHRALRRNWPAMAIFVLCLAASLAATVANDGYERRSVMRNATSDAIDYQRAFQQGVGAYVNFGRDLAAFIGASKELTPDMFAHYLDMTDALRANPGMERVSYATRVPADSSPDQYRVVMVYPGNVSNRSMLGRDISSIRERKVAMERAGETGRPVVTAKHIAGAGSRKSESVAVVIPVYDSTLLGERRAALKGFVFLTFELENIVERIMGPAFKNLFDLEIYDGALGADAILYDGDLTAHALTAQARYPIVHDAKLLIADREWHLFFHPKNVYFERYHRVSSSLILLAGSLVSALAAFLMLKWVRHRSRHAARIEQGHRFEAIFEHHPSAVYSLDLQRRFVKANVQAVAQFKLSKEKLIGSSVEQLIAPENRERSGHLFQDVLRGNSVSYDSAIIDGEGERVEVAVIMIPVTVEGAVTGILGIAQNVTARKHAEWQLKASRSMLQLVIDHIPQRVFWKNTELLYIGCNQSFCHDAGLNNPQQLLGKSDFEMAWRVDADMYRQDDFEVMHSGVARINYEEPQHRESENWLRTSKIPISDIAGKIVGILGVYEDITERKALEDRLKTLAHYDSLTGMANRAFFHGHVQQAVMRCRRHDSRSALMYLDLDRFKSINDTYGHAVGDALLTQFAERIKAAVREMDVVGRLGGDEFAVLLEDVPDQQSAALVAEKIVESMRAEFEIGSLTLQVSASIGVSILVPGMTVDALVCKADEAMYAAKSAGRNRFAMAE